MAGQPQAHPWHERLDDLTDGMDTAGPTL